MLNLTRHNATAIARAAKAAMLRSQSDVIK